MTTSPAARLRLGTRASALARWQADWVASQLQQHGIEVEMVLIATQGDVRSGPIGAIGAQGVFTKEIQRALLDGRIDLAVHSLKDLPTEPVDGLLLWPPCRRGNASGDVLVSNQVTDFESLEPRCARGNGKHAPAGAVAARPARSASARHPRQRGHAAAPPG